MVMSSTTSLSPNPPSGDPTENLGSRRLDQKHLDFQFASLESGLVKSMEYSCGQKRLLRVNHFQRNRSLCTENRIP
jgi:hypothetical protein